MSQIINDLLFGYVKTQALRTAVHFKIADILGDERKSLNTLSREIEANEDSLKRLLGTLVKLKVFATDGEGNYFNNENSDFLRENRENSLVDLISFVSTESYRVFSSLDHSIQNGSPCFEKAFGTDFWNYLKSNRERSRIFNRAMETQSFDLIKALLSKEDFSSYESITDIGGGKGQVLRGIYENGYKFKGFVFELAYLKTEALAYFEKYSLRNIQFCPGNLFEDIYCVSDLNILKFVLHDWPDDKAQQIVNNIAFKMKSGSKILIIDMLKDYNDSPQSNLKDLLMLTTFGSKERTEQEFSTLAQNAGLKILRFKNILGPYFSISLIKP